MKFPEDKSERLKIFALIGIGAFFVIYFGVGAAVRPVLQKRKERLARIDELKAKIETAERVIAFVKGSRQLNKDVVAEILQFAEGSNYVLKARYGNFLLEATEIVESLASRAGVAIESESVKRVGVVDIPAKQGATEGSAFRLYTVRVEAECGLHDLIRLFRELEASNPYLCIAGFSIAGRPENPAAHAIVFDVQWPIWRDKDLPNEIRRSAELLKGD